MAQRMQTLSPYAHLAGGRVWSRFLLTPGVPFPPPRAPAPTPALGLPYTVKTNITFQTAALRESKGLRAGEGGSASGGSWTAVAFTTSGPVHLAAPWHALAASWSPHLPTPSLLPTSHHLKDLPLAPRSQVRLPGLVPRKEAPIQTLHSQILPRCAVPSQAHTYPSLSATQ